MTAAFDRRTSSGPRVSSRFEVQISETGRGVLALVRGPLDQDSAPRLRTRLTGHLHEGGRVVVDLRQAEYVDSSGVRALLVLHRDLEADSGELRLVVEPGSRVDRVIRLLQLQSHFHLCESTADALAAAANVSDPTLVTA
jgi:anti-sigma B factor antagonist